MEGDDYCNTEEAANWSGTLNVSQLCRVCANPKSFLIPIFEGEGLYHELGMKIEKHLPIQVCEDDSLPKQICYHCASTLIAWHDLVTGCVKADQKIRQLQKEEEEEDDEEIDDDKGVKFYETQSLSDTASIQPSTSANVVSNIQIQNEVRKATPSVKRGNTLKEKITKFKIIAVQGSATGPSSHRPTSKSTKTLKSANLKDGTNEESGTSERCQQPPQTSFKAFQQAQSAVWNMYYQKDNTSESSHEHMLWIKTEDDNSETVQNCSQCGENFDRKSELSTHLRKAHSVYVYHCDKCDTVCNEKDQFLSHIKTHEEHIGDDGDVWSESCDLNSYVSEDSISALEAEDKKRSYLEHSNRTTTKTEFICNICGRDFTRKYDLKRHSKCHIPSQDIHTDLNKKSLDQLIDSDKEDVIKSDEDAVVENSKDTKKKRNYLTFHCEVCGKNFTLKDSYFRHMRIHTGEKPFTCHICGKQFRDSGGLARHLKDVHAGIKNFSCEFCGRSFASKATREDHRRIHTGERPYICDSCGKTFKSKASLYIHSKIHTDSFPHPCSYCEKRFRRRQELLAHVTTHTGEKPHACDVCGKCFRVRGELLRHKLIHSEDKPYICTSCGLRFRQKRYLKNHEKSRHGRHEVNN